MFKVFKIGLAFHMEEHRSQSSSPSPKRKPRRRAMGKAKEILAASQPAPIEYLQEFAQSLKNNPRVIQPWTLDPRGNAMSINSFGHIHHPLTCNWPAVKWLRLVEKLLEFQSFGLRETLSMNVEAFQYRFQKRI